MSQYLRKAIDLDPGFVSAYNGLGLAYRLVGKVDEAITWWDKALELSLAYLEKGDKIQALKYFER